MENTNAKKTDKPEKSIISKLNYVDEVTLECFMNKEQYGKHVRKMPASFASKKVNNSDRKFYKKRIYDLTKQLLNNESVSENIFPDVTNGFQNYIKACVDYFKTLDKTDILQEDYQTIDNSIKIDRNNEINVDNISNTQEANQLMMRSIKIQEPNSLEKLVKRTSTKHVKQMILPREKDINLKDPILKNKGIREKKNITNKYEEKNKINKEKIGETAFQNEKDTP
jgi:protoporphyrinogen oxidase